VRKTELLIDLGVEIMADANLRELERKANSGDVEAARKLDREKSRHNMENKVFTIVRIEWQYNDEYYYTGEGNGGNAVAVWRDKARAEEECRRLNRKSARGQGYHGVGNFLGEDPFWNTKPTEETDKLFERIGFSRDETWEYCIPESAADEDVDAFLDFFNMKFYKLTEVDFHG